MNEMNVGEGDIASPNRVVGKYALPDECYEHDSGNILYFVMSPIEVPYRVSQSIKNGYYHFMGIEHDHE